MARMWPMRNGRGRRGGGLRYRWQVNIKEATISYQKAATLGNARAKERLAKLRDARGGADPVAAQFGKPNNSP